MKVIGSIRMYFMGLMHFVSCDKLIGIEDCKIHIVKCDLVYSFGDRFR